jgi:hypothetical protein
MTKMTALAAKQVSTKGAATKARNAEVKRIASKAAKQAETQTSSIAQTLFAALQTRFAALSNLDAVACASQTKQLSPVIAKFNAATIDSAVAKMQQTDFDFVASCIANADQSNAAKYVQVKTIVKMFDMVDRVGQGLRAKSNNFNAIVSAMVANNNKASIADMVVTQCKKAREARQVSEGFTVRSEGYTIGTASSQSGQVRDVLRVFNLASVVKNATNDVAALSDYGQSILKPVYAELSE